MIQFLPFVRLRRPKISKIQPHSPFRNHNLGFQNSKIFSGAPPARRNVLNRWFTRQNQYKPIKNVLIFAFCAPSARENFEIQPHFPLTHHNLGFQNSNFSRLRRAPRWRWKLKISPKSAILSSPQTPLINPPYLRAKSTSRGGLWV